MITSPPSSPRWSPPFAAALLGPLGVAFLPALLWSADRWLGGLLGGAAAGLLTLPICLVLAWLATRRPAWQAPDVDHRGALSAMALVLVAQIAALLAAADERDRLVLSGALLPLAIWIWLWGALGFARARALTLPALFAWFAVPWEYFLRDHVDLPLQAWTADIALQLLSLAGYPLRYWNAYTIYSSEYYVIVNETCSGMNMLMTLGMYTLIFGWLVQPRLGARVALLALVFPLAMLANGLRVATIYLLGHYGGVPVAEGFWHTGSAYLIFLPIFWFVFVVNGALNRRGQAKPRS